ncbi:Metal-sulfur cluster biosynthetic enzyme [Ligilactobacillus sp. WC1T17]|uniref:Metal-sulfur cluster biosynthetic enzyme n=1 Tax=Ligilactobacillus ruminis TaxID=1623 RepID=A0ABY1AAB9_9LACO|nr:Metal-sulfur cluster biosynthetic enzyme [Ligilactobacillus ruminis]
MTERSKEAIKEDILDRLEMVIDPELGVDIVNLGLVYAIDLQDDGTCVVSMTLTTMGCPLTNLLSDLVTNALSDVAEIKQVEVKFVWEPAWSTDRMTSYAKMALGIH